MSAKGVFPWQFQATLSESSEENVCELGVALERNMPRFIHQQK